MALGGQTQPSSSYGVGFCNSSGLWHTDLMKWSGYIGVLDYASMGSLGHGPIHLLIDSASEIRSSWDSEEAGWIRPGLPPLRMMTSPIQLLRSAM